MEVINRYLYYSTRNTWEDLYRRMIINRMIESSRLACTTTRHQACAGNSTFIHFYFATRRTKFKSARQGSALGGANIRSAENIRSRTNDCEVINNVTEPGSRVTCRG